MYAQVFPFEGSGSHRRLNLDSIIAVPVGQLQKKLTRAEISGLSCHELLRQGKAEPFDPAQLEKERYY